MKHTTFFNLFSTVLALIFIPCLAMEQSKEEFREIPAHCCYKGTQIDASTIGQLALAHLLPQEKSKVVREWRDNNRSLLVGLFDFTYKNSEWRIKKNSDSTALTDAGLQNKSAWSYIYTVPNSSDL